MGYQSKTYSLSDEAIERIETLRAEYGSVNKALLAVLPMSNNTSNMTVNYSSVSTGSADFSQTNTTAPRLTVGESRDVTPEGWKSDPPPKPVQGTISVDHAKKSVTVNLDAVAPPAGSSVGKASVETYHREPRKKGDKSR